MKKELLLTIVAISYNCFAQETRINATKNVKPGVSVHEQAIESISASNKLEPNSKGHFEAGKHVLLLPGFEAKTSTVFKANIAEIEAIRERQTISIMAYPNPFINQTEIEIYLPSDTKASVILYSELGVPVSKLIENKTLSKGINTIPFQSEHLVPGIYLASLITENEEKISTKIEKK